MRLGTTQSFGSLGASADEATAAVAAAEGQTATIAEPAEEAVAAPEVAEDEGFLDSKEDGTEDAPEEVKPSTIKKFKANGRLVDVDMADEKQIAQLLQLGLGARQAFTDKDKLAKELKTRDERIVALEKKAAAFDRLQQVGGDPHELFNVITDGKVKFEDVLNHEWQRKQAIANASPEERVKMEMEERLGKLERERAAERAEVVGERKRAEELNNKSRQANLNTVLTGEFSKVSFADKVKDPVLAEELNDHLWVMGLTRLEQYADKHGLEESDVTPELARKVFASVAKTLSGNIEKEVELKVNKTIEGKKKEAKAQAQVASSRSYSATDEEKLSKLSPTKLLEYLRKGK